MTEKKKLIRTATEEEIIEKTLPMFGVEGNWEEITEQPNSSHSVIESGRDGIKLSVAKLGLTRFIGGSAFLGVAGVLLGFLMFAPAEGAMQASFDLSSWTSGEYVIAILTLSIFILMVLIPIMNSLKWAKIEVNGKNLAISYRGWLNTKQRDFWANDIEGIWVDDWRRAGKRSPPRQESFSFSQAELLILKSKDALADGPLEFMNHPMDADCLYVKTNNGDVFKFLVGWPGDELLWIRHELLQALQIES